MSYSVKNGIVGIPTTIFQAGNICTRTEHMWIRIGVPRIVAIELGERISPINSRLISHRLSLCRIHDYPSG